MRKTELFGMNALYLNNIVADLFARVINTTVKARTLN